MIFKILKIVFAFFLMSSNCCAASNPFEYSDAIRENLKMLRQGSSWLDNVEAEREIVIIPEL